MMKITSAGVATFIPAYTTVNTYYYDIGQILDGSGSGTNQFVSWQSPGATWNPSLITNTNTASGVMAGFSGVEILTVGLVDYAINGFRAVSLDGSTAVTISIPSSAWITARTYQVVYVPHAAAIVVYDTAGWGSNQTPSFTSTDLGQTWTASTFSVSAAIQAAGIPTNLGSLLMRY
jgi:hypothetical protein